MLNEIEPPSSSIAGDDNYDMDYLSDSDQYISIEESRYRTSIVLPTNSQIGFEIALAAVAAEPDSDTDEEKEDDVSVYVGMHFSIDMSIVSFANRSISFIYHSIRTSYVTERRGVECRRRTT